MSADDSARVAGRCCIDADEAPPRVATDQSTLERAQSSC